MEDWLSLVFFIVFGLIGLIQKLAKENKGPAKTIPSPAPRTGSPTPLPPWLQTGQAGLPPQTAAEGEGQTLEDALSALFEGEGATEEGVSLEGGSTEAPLVPEVLEERAELAKEVQEFRTEATRLTSDEETPAAGQTAAPGEDFSLDWEDPFARDADEIESGANYAAAPVGHAWLSRREDLIRAVLAAEILRRPGTWRQRRIACQRL